MSEARSRPWSGRRDSNPRPIAWKAMTLPAELLPPKKINAHYPKIRLALQYPEQLFVRRWLKRALSLGPRPRLATQPLRASGQKVWRGQDSNLRRPEGRRVYSPLPLSARPPLHNLSIRQRRLSETWTFRNRVACPNCQSTSGRAVTLPLQSEPRKLSWRRESNPQPTDYKSVALPLSYASTKR